MNIRQTGLIPIVPIILAACAVGPDYHRPSAPMPVRFREAEGWKPGELKEAASGTEWWSVYEDPALSGLIKTPNNVWSLGGTLSETVLDFRSRRYQVQQARAAYDETVAMYRSITIHSVQIASNKLWLRDRQW